MSPRRPNSKQRILSAARTEFAAHGFAGTSVQQIARRAGVNKQLVFYYFGSKAGLHAAATCPADRPTRTPTTGRSDPQDFRSVLAATFEQLVGNPALVSALVDRQGAPDAISAAGAYLEGTIRTIAGVISEGQGMGHFRDDADPHHLARQSVVLLAGYLALEPHMAREVRDRPAWLAEAVRLLLAGASWR